MYTKANSKKILDTKTLVGISLLTAISIIFTRFFSVMIPIAGLPALRFGFGDIPLIISGILFGPVAGALAGVVADLLGVMINLQGAFFPGFTLSAALTGAIPGLIFHFIKKGKGSIKFHIFNTIVILALAIGVTNVILNTGALKINENGIYFNNNKTSILYVIAYFVVIALFIILPIIFTKKSKEGLYSFNKIVFVISINYLIISLGLNTLWLSIMFKKGFFVFLPGRVLAGLIVIPLHSTIIYTLSKYFKYAIK